MRPEEAWALVDDPFESWKVEMLVMGLHAELEIDSEWTRKAHHDRLGPENRGGGDHDPAWIDTLPEAPV